MLLTKLLAFPMAMVMSASASAAEVEYNGEVDIYDGSPTGTSESYRNIKLPDGSEYDMQEHMFIYSSPKNNQSLVSSVADGMITTKTVSLRFDNGLDAALYRDGDEDDNINIENIKDPGKYSVVTKSAEVEQQILSFTILPEKTGDVTSYKLPSGFELTEVSVSGTPRELSDTSTVDFKEEGKYIISYSCTLTNVTYGFTVEVDHTPPEITFENLGENKKARGAVTIKGIEKTDKAVLKVDGEEKKFPSDGVVSLPGKYELTVTDDAGNSVTEKFTISFYLNYQGVLFGTLLAGMLIGLVVYMIMARKRMRVR